MNRILRGVLLFAVSTLLWACNTEPGFLPVDARTLVADPGVLFVPLGRTEQVLVRLVDAEGTSRQAEMVVTGSAAVTVAADPLFRPVYGPDGTLQVNTSNTELRFTVTGAALGAAEVTVTSGEMTLVVPVTVTP